ncbi:TA system antitoxin ParD family protein [Roseibium aggregatum]|uniref:TA system antitoxin ParD family protein n=1 Tax=Roseibium aggregatum TaxID=187304 RepID=UPI0025AB6109|nr:hypothetical protein [Roseibium aggregatum]WJS00330.1 hypothetical protein QUB73_14150 [Roseibium aggregatum]
MAQSVELGDDVMALVRCEAELQNRSIAELITHWLRVGRAIEKSGAIDQTNITAVLTGELETTALTALEKVVWSESFLEKMSEPSPGEQAFFAELRKNGDASGLDVFGDIVITDGQSESESRTKPDRRTD